MTKIVKHRIFPLSHRLPQLLRVFFHCVNVKEKKRPSDLWITKSIIVSSKTKHKLFKKKQKFPTVENIERFTQYNNLFNKIKRAAKRKFFREKLEENKSNIKETWRIINMALNRNKTKKVIPLLLNIKTNVLLTLKRKLIFSMSSLQMLATTQEKSSQMHSA